MIFAVELTAGVRLRTLADGDAPAMRDAYERNREHLAPYEPARPDSFYTLEGQQERLDRLLKQHAAGEALPCAMVRDGRIVGNATLREITYGPVCEAAMGYWVATEVLRQGVASATVAALCRIADEELDLHRIEAGTAPQNEASQGVLKRNGFEQFGYASKHLYTGGRWGDAVLFEKVLNDRPPASRR
jgi:ribosomal-protein-alanine N-acetyltransferase